MIVLYMITDQFVKIAQQRQLTLLHHCGQSFGLLDTLVCPLAFSTSSQLFYRINSESQARLVDGTAKQSLEQMLRKKRSETARRKFPFSGKNSSCLMLVIMAVGRSIS
jgi:hypothetical protein